MREALPPDLPGEWVGVGEVLTTHGVQGELKVLPLTDDPSRWEELTRVFGRTAEVTLELHVENVRYFKQFVIVKFREIADLSTAESLRGSRLWIPKSERKTLPPDRFYTDDLLQMDVFDDAGRLLGKIEQVMVTGANDVFVVKDEGEREILLPALKSVVLQVDLAGKRMTVRIPPGLLEDDEG